MDELNERELLLLSNYAYFNCSKEDGTIKENIDKLKNGRGKFDTVKLQEQGVISSNMSEDEAIDLLTQIENDDRLSGLTNSRSINTGDLRGVLYTDENENATLVFRGTGGTYKAWYDNVSGSYKSDTKIQKLAGDFVKNECAQYKNITVTGHSKGGNLSQYVTVTCSDQIGRCVSYDGQGFGKSFLEKYKDEIEQSSNKITSISANNDFVNILLYSIAGTAFYVNNEGTGADGHSSYRLFSSAKFDADGNFSQNEDVTAQTPLMALAKRAGDGIVEAIDLLPDDGNKHASDVLGALVASVMSADKSEEYEKAAIKNSVDEFKKYGGKMLGIINTDFDIPNVNYVYTAISIDKIKSVYAEISEQLDMMYTIPETIEDVLVRLDYSIMGRSLTENALKRTIAKTDKIIKMTDKLCETLKNIILCYERYDNEIAEDVKLLYHE